MDRFSVNSAFAFVPPVPYLTTEAKDVLEGVEKVAKSDLEQRINHWHHDLRTIFILLDQHHPDIDRAKRLIEEMADEMYREL